MKVPNQYSRLVVVLHWATAACVFIAYVLSEGGRDLSVNPPVLHFVVGLATLLLVLPRLVGRLVAGAVKPASDRGEWLLRVRWLAHAALYALLVTVPLSGWYVVGRLGIPVVVGGFTLPSLAPRAAGHPGILADLHQVGGNLLVILAALHAAMGLWHHFVWRDGTLRRMNPF
jgi:superoxide oxidase